jgi:hypothetical protein
VLCQWKIYALSWITLWLMPGSLLQRIQPLRPMALHPGRNDLLLPFTILKCSNSTSNR